MMVVATLAYQRWVNRSLGHSINIGEHRLGQIKHITVFGSPGSGEYRVPE